MSARRVCSGTRPSRYHSLRLISAPPRRPPHCTRIPCAPAFIAVWTARFIARRNDTRPASWSATPWAMSVASSSGCLISWMLKWIFGLPVICSSPARRRSAPLPRPPDTTAGPGGVHVDTEAVARPLDLDAAHRCVRELAPQVVADLPVLDQRLLVLVLVGEPARLPVGGDAEAEPVRVDLLAHQSSFFFFVVFFVVFCGFLAVVF